MTSRWCILPKSYCDTRIHQVALRVMKRAASTLRSPSSSTSDSSEDWKMCGGMKVQCVTRHSAVYPCTSLWNCFHLIWPMAR